MKNITKNIVALCLCLSALVASAAQSSDSTGGISRITVRQSGKQQTAIEWQVEDLSKIEFFRVESSTDGQNFSLLTVIRTVDGKYRYQCLDDRLSNRPEKYYRIILVDAEGKDLGSATSQFRLNMFSGKLQLSPNPAADQINLQISGNERGMIILNVFNSSGLMIKQWVVNKQDEQLTQALDISQFQEGNYILQVKHNSRTESLQFIKSN